MAHTYKYAILTAIPDQRRGERVNIGVVVFLADRLDIRFAEISKLRTLAAGDWNSYVNAARRHLGDVFSSDHDPASTLAKFSSLDRVLHFSDIAWFSVPDAAKYEAQVDAILESLVLRPKGPSERPKSTRINTELASEFKRAKLLASADEGINDHKILRDFPVAKEENIRADFVLKNGVFHVTATLDLRKVNVEFNEAALKAIVLDKARDLGKGRGKSPAKLYGVYAAPVRGSQFKSHIELLNDYSDKIFNWSVEADRRSYLKAIYAALPPPAMFGRN